MLAVGALERLVGPPKFKITGIAVDTAWSYAYALMMLLLNL